jgi:hypothetical protein
MLAVLRFLLQLSLFYGNPFDKGFTHFCDNEGLVSNINSLTSSSQILNERGFEECSPPLISDWDVTNKIQHTLHELQGPQTFRWVKGHQDKDTSYDQLPLEAQLNVDADKLAGSYQCRKGATRTVVPKFPHNQAQLSLSGNTITAGYKGRLWYAMAAPALLATMQECYKWDEATIQTIDWNAHSQAIRSKSKQRVTLVKLIHDITPTNRCVARYGQGRDPKCPRCWTDEETCHHLILCPLAAPWRRSFLQSLRRRCDELCTDPVLQEILLSQTEG